MWWASSSAEADTSNNLCSPDIASSAHDVNKKKYPLVLVCNRAVRSLQSNLSLLHISTLGAPSLPVVIQDTDQFNFPSSPSHYSILSSHNIKQNHSKNKLLLTEMKNKKIALFTKNDHSKERDNQNKGTWLMALDDHWTAYQINGR